MPPLLAEDQVRDARMRIRAVAERQFAELGFERTSMRTIARELGWTAASLYRYFKNKAELLAATRAAAIDRQSDMLEAAGASSSDPWRRSRAIGDAFVKFAFDEPAAYRLMYALEQPGEDQYPDLARAQARSRRLLTDYAEAMVATGEIEGDPNIIAHAFWAVVHGAIVLQMAGKLNGASPGFEEVRRQAVRLIARGARPSARRKT
ncbi:MAG: TetR/AcrR family transcriptional regulator [Hyphomonadaceae bacterium]